MIAQKHSLLGDVRKNSKPARPYVAAPYPIFFPGRSAPSEGQNRACLSVDVFQALGTTAEMRKGSGEWETHRNILVEKGNQSNLVIREFHSFINVY